MSAAAIITYLLGADSGIAAVVGDRNFASPQLPANTALPATNAWEVSGRERLTVSMGELRRLRTDRVQVSVHAKTGAQLRQLLTLVRAALSNRSGTVNGFAVDSILPDLVGPDLSQPEARIFERSRDFIVKWHKSV